MSTDSEPNSLIEILPRKSEDVKLAPLNPKSETKSESLSLSTAIKQTPRPRIFGRSRVGHLKSSDGPTLTLSNLKQALFKAPLVKPLKDHKDS